MINESEITKDAIESELTNLENDEFNNNGKFADIVHKYVEGSKKADKSTHSFFVSEIEKKYGDSASWDVGCMLNFLCMAKRRQVENEVGRFLANNLVKHPTQDAYIMSANSYHSLFTHIVRKENSLDQISQSIKEKYELTK